MFYNRLRATSILSFIQGLGVVASVLRNKATALLIGATGVGLINYFNQGISLVGQIAGFGLSFSGIQRLSRLHERGNLTAQKEYVALLRTWTLLVALLGTLTGIGVGTLIGWFATGSWEQTPQWLLLSPAIAFSILNGTEGAILKATRQLRLLAWSMGGSTFATLFLAVGVYWCVGIRGVVFVLVSSLAVQFLLMYLANHRQFPFRLTFRSPLFRKVGVALFRLGVPYLGAALVGSGIEMLISVSLYRLATVEAVGLYAAGFTLTVSYVRLLFTAVEADYFPQLSAMVTCPQQAIALANEQIDILVLLVAPILILFAALLPWLVPLLYAASFAPIVPMVACALFSMFFKAIYTPVAYFPLAHAKSHIYFVMETLYYLVLCATVVGGFYIGSHYSEEAMRGGLIGAGIGITLANLFDCWAILTVYHFRFHFSLTTATLRRCLLQGIFVATGLMSTFIPTTAGSIATTIVCFLFSAVFSGQQLGIRKLLCRNKG